MSPFSPEPPDTTSKAGLGSFRIVTFAASFHWMDRPRVASAVATMLDPGEDRVFQEAGFLPPETVTVPDQRPVERTIDDVVARVFSTSSTAPHLLGDRQEDYERDMREILTQASPSGRFSVRLPDNILRIWRLPA